MVDRPVRASSTPTTSRPRARACRSTCPAPPSSPRSTFEWKIPKWSNAIERNRARTYFQAYAAAAALDFIEKALDEVQAGHTKTWEPFEVPDEAIGCGFTEAVRGVLSHHMVIKGGKIANYHPYPPTPWNGNPRDVYGTPGPYEDAVQNTPIFEENDREHFKGIDIMRAVRSFDPCLPCGVHMYLGKGKVLRKLHSPTMVNNAESYAGTDDAEHAEQPSSSRRPDRAAARRSFAARSTRSRGSRVEEVLAPGHRLYGGGPGPVVRGRSATTPAVPRCSARLVDDELVASLLVLHGLHPSTSRSGCARRSTTCARTWLPRRRRRGARDRRRGGHRARCGCWAAATAARRRRSTLQLAVEQAIAEAAPEVAHIEVEGSSSRSRRPPATAISRAAEPPGCADASRGGHAMSGTGTGGAGMRAERDDRPRGPTPDRAHRRPRAVPPAPAAAGRAVRAVRRGHRRRALAPRQRRRAAA